MQAQDQQDYDVYFRGNKEQLYAFLFPLTGPQHSLFDHLDLIHTHHDPSTQSFQMHYQPKDFTNIDKQKEDVVYHSARLPTQSHYYYSTYQPEYNCLVWQQIDHFVQMRPKSQGVAPTKTEAVTEMQSQQLEVVAFEDPNNKVRQALDDAITTPLKPSWQVSKDEYLMHLSK